DVSVASDRMAIEAMKAEIDGGAVEGRIAVSHQPPNSGSRLEAELKAERLDLDAATALARSLAGPQAEWPDEAQLSLDIGRADRANARVAFELDAPQLKGIAAITVKPEVSAMRAIDLDALQRGEFSIESKLSSERGRSLLALLGLDRAIAGGEGAAQFEGSVAGVWRAPLRLKAKMSGAGFDAEAQGTAEPWAAEPKANVNLAVRGVNLAPLFDLKPSDSLAQNISLSSRASLTANKLTFDDLGGTMSGSRLRGRIALALDDEKHVEGEIGLDTLDLAPAFALAIG